jgi:glycosyltransferase involved in cell wall biosynthesis
VFGRPTSVPRNARSLRVLIVIENTSYTYDTRVRNISRTLARAGCRVWVLCPRYAGDPFARAEDNITIFYFPLPPLPAGIVGHLIEYAYCSVAIALGSLLLFCTTRFDVIHICNPPDIFFPLGGVYRLLGRRFVFDLHDLWPELWLAQRANWPSVYWLILLMERLSLKTASHVLVTSETARRRIQKRARVDASRVTLVRNGPDLTHFAKPDLAVGVQPELIEVGYVGDMNPQDGIAGLLLAARHISHDLRRANICFVLIGDGNAHVELRRQAEELELAGVVEFTGRLSPRAAMRRLSACALCVQPDPKNPFNDSCVMVKSLEYMALAKPFVAFDLSETRRVCGNAALYATGNDHRSLAAQLLRLAEDPELRRVLGARGRRRIERGLAWSFSTRHLLQVYGRFGQEMNKTIVDEPERFQPSIFDQVSLAPAASEDRPIDR